MAEKIPEKDIRLQWVAHPAKKSPARTTLAVAAVLLAGLFAGWAMQAPGFGILALIVMFAALSKFFLPTRYIFTDETVSIKSLTTTFTRPWNQIRSFYVDKNGALLSPFVTRSRLENFRGMYLIFGDNRDAAIEFIKSHIRKPELPPEITETTGKGEHSA